MDANETSNDLSSSPDANIAETVSSPPSTPMPANAETRGVGVMVFQVGRGELPNVLQYLNFSGKSGKLEVDCKQMLAERGVVCFAAGEVYYARLGPVRGMDAVAQMAAFPTAEAIFVEGEKIAAKNIDMPARQLVETVAAQCGQGEAGGGGEGAGEDSEEFIVPAHAGSRVVVRHTGNGASGSGAEPGKEGGSRLAVALVILAAVAVIVNAIWVVSELSASVQRKHLAKEQEQIQAEKEDVERQRRKKINDMLQKAVDDYKSNRLEEGAAGVEAVLVVDPGNEAALTLQKRIVEASSLVDLVHLRADAEMKKQTVDALVQHPLFKAEAEAAQTVYKNARILFEHQDYSAAVPQYRLFTDTVDALAVRKGHHDQALESQNQIPKFKKLGMDLKASRHAPEVWQRAAESERKGDVAFSNGDFATAGEAWKAAGQMYREAAELTRERVALQAAQARFENLLGEMDEAVLEQYAKDGWQTVKGHEREARQAALDGALAAAAEAWDRGAKLLPEIWEKAIGERNRVLFEEQMARGRQAVADRNWAEAEAAFEQVVGLAGYKDNREARELWTQAREINLTELCGKAREAEDWNGLKVHAKALLASRPDSDQGQKYLLMAENMLLPRLAFEVSADGRQVADAQVTVSGDEAVVEAARVFRLIPGGNYTFKIQVPPQGDVFYESATVSHAASDSGLKTLAIQLERIRAPRDGQGWQVPGLAMDLVAVPAGSYSRGGNSRGEERPVHHVKLSRPFWVGAAEVTNRQYRRFLEEAQYDGSKDTRSNYLKHLNEKSEVPAGDDYPACYVSWHNAFTFCKWLTARERRSERLPEGYVYRLPTEAEWEYACRAGSKDDFAGDPLKMAWHGNRSADNEKVGGLAANAWGIHDAHGNVWEFCHDWYGAYSGGSQTDPSGPEKGYFKIIRGGSWRDSLDQCRSSYRSQIPANEARNNVGFRIVLAPDL